MTLPRQHLLQHSDLFLHARFALQEYVSPVHLLDLHSGITRRHRKGKEALTVPPLAVLISTLFS